MATVMKMHAPADRAGYERVMEALGDEPIEGLLVHMAFEKDDGQVMVIDLWESEDQFRAFADGRLATAMQNAGLDPTRQPDVRFHEAIGYLLPAREGALA